MMSSQKKISYDTGEVSEELPVYLLDYHISRVGKGTEHKFEVFDSVAKFWRKVDRLRLLNAFAPVSKMRGFSIREDKLKISKVKL